MDFKVAGTKDGITAIQMDIKFKASTRSILTRALEQARIGRLSYSIEARTLPEPRKELSKFAPRIISFNNNPDKIATLRLRRQDHQPDYCRYRREDRHRG
jgi:polyribonucleotide nucleotidyltransferase